MLLGSLSWARLRWHPCGWAEQHLFYWIQVYLGPPFWPSLRCHPCGRAEQQLLDWLQVYLGSLHETDVAVKVLAYSELLRRHEVSLSSPVLDALKRVSRALAMQSRPGAAAGSSPASHPLGQLGL
jgi:hypothetical protein